MSVGKLLQTNSNRLTMHGGAQGQQGYGMASQQQVPQWAQSAIASQAAFGGQAQQYAQQANVPVAAVPVRAP